jgi:hypothetical protein
MAPSVCLPYVVELARTETTRRDDLASDTFVSDRRPHGLGDSRQRGRYSPRLSDRCAQLIAAAASAALTSSG